MTDILNKFKNFLKITTLLLILVSIVTPFAYQVTQVFAQEYDVQMEVKYKDGSRQSIFKTEEALLDEALPEIQPAGEMPEVETEFSPEQIKEIDEAGGITYDRYHVASVDEIKLKELGYTSGEIADIAKMVEFYNSFKVLSVEIIDLKAQREAKKVSFGVTASAGCEPKHSVRWHPLHAEMFLNQCIITHIELGVIGVDVLAAVIVAGSGGTLTPLGILIAAYFNAYPRILSALSNMCDNEGANLNIPYIGAAAMWVSSVC